MHPNGYGFEVGTAAGREWHAGQGWRWLGLAYGGDRPVGEPGQRGERAGAGRVPNDAGADEAGVGKAGRADGVRDAADQPAAAPGSVDEHRRGALWSSHRGSVKTGRQPAPIPGPSNGAARIVERIARNGGVPLHSCLSKGCEQPRRSIRNVVTVRIATVRRMAPARLEKPQDLLGCETRSARGTSRNLPLIRTFRTCQTA